MLLPLWLLVCVFFFSSRRRHTRLVSDWSSDVCSSDLIGDQCQLVGDDLFVTNEKRLKDGITQGAGNSILDRKSVV